MSESSRVKATIGERLREELYAYAIVAGYLYVCIGVLTLYKTAILRDVGIVFAPLGFAAVKALILGKFILLGKAAGLGARGGAASLGWRIVRKAVLFLALLIVLEALEEVASGWLHGHSIAETVAELGDAPLLTALADALVLLLVLVPFIALTEISAALGPGVLVRMLRGERT